MSSTPKPSHHERSLRVAELFAGVGGFRLGLESADKRFQTVWANQWEPSTKTQHAADCYVERFGLTESDYHGIVQLDDDKSWCAHRDDETFWCADIAELTHVAEAEMKADGTCHIIPEHDLLVGGFPCQDYSVAKPKNQAQGIRGIKGVLWWQIHKILELRSPKYLLLENVDRLLKSPASQRGRDFAILLSSLSDLGYAVEWRVVNAAEYGYPQRRRRVFIYGERKPKRVWRPLQRLTENGIMARALPVKEPCEDDRTAGHLEPDIVLDRELYRLSESFGTGLKKGPFKKAGVMFDHKVWTQEVTPDHSGRKWVLGDVLLQEEEVDEEYLIPPEQFERWEYLKKHKDEKRIHKATGTPYRYQEGSMDWDRPEKPARTILTGEGGSSPSRFKHAVVIDEKKKRYRRLTPEELEMLNGFPAGWTDTGMTTIRRAFCMGNALVVGVVRQIGEAIAKEAFGDLKPPRRTRGA